MIRHVVSWKLTADEPAEKADHATGIIERLQSLVGVVSEIRTLSAAADVAGGSNWDVVLIADFDDLAAVERYQVHPAHVTAAAFIRSVAANRMAVDIEV